MHTWFRIDFVQQIVKWMNKKFISELLGFTSRIIDALQVQAFASLIFTNVS